MQDQIINNRYMDPSKSQPSGEGQRVSFLSVASPTSVIVATPTTAAQPASGAAQLHISQGGHVQPSILLPQTAAVGGTPIILGLISTDTGNLTGTAASATVLKVDASLLQTADGTQTSSLSSSTQARDTAQTVQTSQEGATQSGGSYQSKEGTVTSKTTPPGGRKSVTDAPPVDQKVATTSTGGQKVVSTPPKGQKSGAAPSEVQKTGVTPPGLGGHGTGKPKSFAALLTGEGAKKQTTPTKKAQSSKGGSFKSKSKATPPNPSTSSGPTRSSHRAVKRPRTYDEDLAELEIQMQKVTKKPKGAPKGGVSKSQKKSGRPQISVAIKDLGRWRPTDDLMLISAVQQTNDLAAVHLGVKFSCRFTLQEVEERWYALLYDPQISKLAVEAMRALHPGVVTMALNNALWSQEEEYTLAKIPSTDPGHLETFQSLLRDNPCVFHACRTATSLHHHWVLMGHYNLLNNQKVDFILPGEATGNFGDAEDQLYDNELQRPQDVKEAALEQELMAIDCHAKKEIMRLEEELPRWRTIIDTGTTPDFGPDEYAILRGKVVEFQMTTRAVTLGRNTPSSQVDFDLSLEAPAFKISRKQATIHISSDGDFIIHNDGRRPLFLDGKALISGKSTKLQHNQMLEVASMSFLVLLNTKLVASLSGTS